MVLFYVGHRPVVKERFVGDNVHPWKGTVEKYSNYSIFNTANVLDGAPNHARVVEPYDKESPMDDPGKGPRAHGSPFRTFEYKGIPGDAPLRGSFGHTPGTSVYASGARYHQSPWDFNGVESENVLKGEFGHSLRERGGAATFGRFNPHDPHSRSVGEENPLETDYGQTQPEGYDNPYGKNRVAEWRGVPGDKAIF